MLTLIFSCVDLNCIACTVKDFTEVKDLINDMNRDICSFLRLQASEQASPHTQQGYANNTKTMQQLAAYLLKPRDCIVPHEQLCKLALNTGINLSIYVWMAKGAHVNMLQHLNLLYRCFTTQLWYSC